MNGGVEITNSSSEEAGYVPIVIHGGTAETAAGGTLVLNSDLSFVAGEPENDKTVVIEAPEPVDSTWGRILLTGERAFNIAKGAAAADLAIQPVLADNGVQAGSLVKTGAGVLALDGANTFSGGTLVNDGVLAGNGVLASDVTVAAGAALAPGRPDAIGTLTLEADLEFADGARLLIDTVGAAADLLVVEGDVTGTGTVVVEPTIENRGEVEEWLIMTASSIEPSFVSATPGWSFSKRNSGKQLWLTRTGATIVIIR